MNKISFDNFRAQSKQYEENKLFCLLVGIRGAGKSTAIGSLRVPTLLIASSLESHSIEATQMFNEGIIPTLYDVDDEGRQLKPDAALNNLHSILDYLISSPDLKVNIQAIALDSFSAIDKTILETTKILMEKNGFERPKLIQAEHLRVVRKLKEISRRGVHVITTIPIMATINENGLYVSAKPELQGGETTSILFGIFNEVLPVTKMGSEHVFQMDLTIKKSSKDANGVEKSTISFPRITGLNAQDLIAAAGEALLLPADLDYVYKLKKAKKGVSE